LDAVVRKQQGISGLLSYAGRVLVIALPMLAVTYAIFSDALAPTLPSLPLTFAVLPFVIWAALRFGRREVTALNALVCTIAVWHTLQGHGPFASAALTTSLLLLLAFMGTLVSTGLVLNAVVGERSRAFEALAQALRTLKEEAIRDPLTNLYNRRFLRDYLSRELMRAARESIRVAVIMIDLDRFKRVNDTAGHAAGDFVLTEIAALLKRHIRGTDIACRYGGEEFTLVLPTPLSRARAGGARRFARRYGRKAAVSEASPHRWAWRSSPITPRNPRPCCARPIRRSTTRKAGGAIRSGFSRTEPPRSPRFARRLPSARTDEPSRKGPACIRKRILLAFLRGPHTLGPRSKGEIPCNLTFI